MNCLAIIPICDNNIVLITLSSGNITSNDVAVLTCWKKNKSECRKKKKGKHSLLSIDQLSASILTCAMIVHSNHFMYNKELQQTFGCNYVHNLSEHLNTFLALTDFVVMILQRFKKPMGNFGEYIAIVTDGNIG